MSHLTESSNQPEKVEWSKGTLRYTKGGIVVLFAYLLWGDFCLQFMETVLPAILPLQLKEIGASNTTIALFAATFPSFFNLVTNPFVSFKSDNFRSAMGRRLPFLMVSAPLVSLFLMLIAFAPDIGTFLASFPLSKAVQGSSSTAILGVFGLFLALFQMFNYCLQPVFYYLLVDVVPVDLMGRFISLFRIVGTLSGFVFHTFVFAHATTYAREIYIAAAVLCLAGFFVVCRYVKEGSYPPPTHAPKLGLLLSTKIYIRECYTTRHYILFYLRNICMSIAGVIGIYKIFVARDELGIPLSFVGTIAGWATLLVTILMFPMGMITDRIKPVPVVLLASVISVILPLVSFFFLRDSFSYVWITFLGLPLAALATSAELPFHVSILPQSRYGQFGSANQIVCAFSTIIGSIVSGMMIDHFTNNGTNVQAYRLIYVWESGFQFVALFFMALLFCSWQRLGGSESYVAPEPS